jgi:4-aminobutyrate--pyruvate transaminase
MLYEELGIVGHVQDLEPHFQSRLRALASHPLVGEARGVGLIGALEIVADKQAKRPFQGTAGVGNAIQSAAAERGLIVRAIRDAIAVCPPLIITHDQIDELFDKFALALDDCVPLVRQHGLQAGTSP